MECAAFSSSSVGSNPVHGFEVRDYCRVRVDEPGFRRVRSLVFPNLVLDLTYIWPNKFEVRTICRDSKGFEVRFWWTSLGSKEFEVRPVKFEAVRSSIYLGSTQH